LRKCNECFLAEDAFRRCGRQHHRRDIRWRCAKFIERQATRADRLCPLFSDLGRTVDDQERKSCVVQDLSAAPRHRRHADEGNGLTARAAMHEHPRRGKIRKRRRARRGAQAMYAICHRQGLAQKAIERRSADSGRAGRIPRAAQLGSDLMFASLRGIKTAGEEKDVLDRCLAGPCAQRLGGLAQFRIAAAQRAEDSAALIARRGMVRRRKDDFDAIAGRKEDDLCAAQCRAQIGQPRLDFRFGNGKARNVLDACVAI
jgi:hypothetical protein